MTFRRNLRPAVLLLLGIVGLLILISVGTLMYRLLNGAAEYETEGAFYTTTNIDISVRNPGELLRSEPLASAPEGIKGWRVIYRSTDKDNNPIIASGLIAAPITSDEKKLPVVSWGHPTTGVAQKCAPSVGIDPFDSIEGLRDIVKAGYVVAAADYSGMGVEGPPSFLIGDSEGRTVLDVVQAAQQVPDAHAGNDVTFWGHSQGGHAALFASGIASQYAPGLSVKGVALAAPATNLVELLKADINTTGGVTIGSYAFNQYSEAYGVDMSTILTTKAKQTTYEAVKLCLLGQNSQLHSLTEPLIGNFLIADPGDTEPWASLLSSNTPIGPPDTVPLYVAQGQKDELVKPNITAAFVNAQKERGLKVTYESLPDATHATVALDAMPSMITWLKALE